MTRKDIFKYVFFDIIASLIVWLLFYLYRRFTNDLVLFGIEEGAFFVPSYSLSLSMLAFPIVATAIYYTSGFYNRKVKRSRIVEFFTTLSSTFILSIIIYFVMLIDDEVVNYHFYYQSFLILWFFFFFFTYSFRLIITMSYIYALRRGEKSLRVLVVGTGDLALKVANVLKTKSKISGQQLVGYVAVRDRVVVDANEVLGKLSSIESIVEENNVIEVIIAVDDMDNDIIYNIANRMIKCGVSVKFSLRLFEIVTGHNSSLDLLSEPFVEITRSVMPAWQQSVKRIFDVIVSIISIILLLPLLCYVSVRVKLDSKGPLLFKQQRIGYGGKDFNILKFRTMYVDAEKMGPQLSKVNDPRITPYGRIMRKYRFDELPQFFNILRGDMSIVGPRPERRFYIEQIEEKAPYFCLLYRVQPGLFSWGPIKIGYCDSVDKMVERLNYDLIYVDNMSILNDIKILFYSVGVLINGKGQ